MWIFGYGSLVWKVDFPYTEKLIGYIKGYDRRFWQASIDHRGTPEKPGRVVTLVPSAKPEAQVWGIAYQIPDTEKTAICALLTREKRFSRLTLDFYPGPPPNSQSTPSSPSPSDQPTFKCVTFVGNIRNPLYLGPPATLEDLIEQIAECEGPSGKNSEYIFKLADWHRQNFPEIPDLHLFDIEKALREYLVWGAAYKLDERNLEETLRRLDHREVMGYEKVPILFYPVLGHPLNEEGTSSTCQAPGKAFEVVMYYGSRENEHFVGEEDGGLEGIGRRIWESRGPSGENKEYLFGLCEAMRRIMEGVGEGEREGILDEHLRGLEGIVRRLEEEERISH